MARKSRASKLVKIEDVAAAAGVSIMTVSRALRGVEGVSEGKRLEIIEISQRLGYRPNPNARSLMGGASGLIGISFPTLFNDVFAGILDGLRPAFEANGFTTVVNTTEYDADRERAWVEQVLSWRPAGLVLTGADHGPTVREAIQTRQIPTLQVWDFTDAPIDICVGVDHQNAGYQLARAMIALGYRQPGYVGIQHGKDQRAEKRLNGICHAFAEAGLGAVAEMRMPGSSYRAGYDGFQALWAQAPRPDIVFFLSDHFAFAGLMACQVMGIRVPDEVGLAGFNGLDITEVLPLRLTTARTPRRKMGVQGAKNLIARMHGVSSDLSVELQTELIHGETTRRP
ncbi:LacI family DNA-binding transcriptional regulator [Actibacterium sp. 188UL27-1]|uniref:LacI family DNA-binding transcriptional regulator n=1 Tax=Actibacterium sp. 188UL27-1 TaxID=2786961 RepID=UPI00195B3018|nr:LacI family DNA-binding transcriptional regulator [Actibacterium sp. 188UL27-1]MBM7066116.1 LacI family DNA-binding transcriptional regulator [Actibacterium sp. 188UL27-1]